jgi:hypothetical protein
MNNKTTLPLNAPAILGILGSAVPLLFWTAVALELVFRNTFLMSSFFSPIDQVSSFLTITLLVLVPAAVLLVNFFFVFRFSLDKADGEFRFTAALKPRLVNLGVVVFTACNILLILAYTITENFILVPRH